MKRLIKGVNDHIFRTPNIPWGKISPEAVEVLAKFPNTLASGEADKIIQIVDLMVLGNYKKYDFLFGWFLTDPVNRLTSWFGSKTATAVFAPSFNAFGVLTNGTTNYIETNIIPSTDGTNALKNDSHAEFYMHENLSVGNGDFAVGVEDGSNRFRMFQQPGVNQIHGSINAAVNMVLGTSNGLFLDKTRYGLHRDDSLNSEMYIDGVEVHTEADASSGLPTNSITIGANNVGASKQSLLNARQSFFIYGGGFDITALNTELDLIQSLFNLN